jgi:hypothetical protein
MDCAWNKGVATRGILMDHIRYHTTRSSKWIKPAAPFSKGIPCSLVQYLSDFLGEIKRYLSPSTPPPTPTPSRRPPWTSCQRRPDWLVPGIFRYRTYLKWEYTDGIWNRYTRDIQIGTSYSLDVRLGQKSRTKAWFDQENRHMSVRETGRSKMKNF